MRPPTPHDWTPSAPPPSSTTHTQTHNTTALDSLVLLLCLFAAASMTVSCRRVLRSRHVGVFSLIVAGDEPAPASLEAVCCLSPPSPDRLCLLLCLLQIREKCACANWAFEREDADSKLLSMIGDKTQTPLRETSDGWEDFQEGSCTCGCVFPLPPD